MKKILMTGGGTAGHVTPNIALFDELKRVGYEIHYVGSKDGMEKQLIEREGITYHGISAGKLRRYFDMKNFTDTIKISRGFIEAIGVISRVKPSVVFSKGGFVSSPVVWAAWARRIPVIIHESDITPGLANKLSIPFAKKVCFAFPETEKYLPSEKAVLTGIPVRKSLLKGSREMGMELCKFNDSKPVILLIGGSLGSGVLNKTLRENLDTLAREYNICHVCGKGNVDKDLLDYKGYKQFEYVNEELKHIFALTDLVISRAGATVLFEILTLKKPNLLIPLSKQASRGDQILNANSFKKLGFSEVLMEEELTPKTFLEGIRNAWNGREKQIKAMESSALKNGVDEVVKLIREISKDK